MSERKEESAGAATSKTVADAATEHGVAEPVHSETHDDPPARPTFATVASSAPAQAVLSPEQFRKIDVLQKSVRQLSRRCSMLVFLNLIMLGVVGWGWYKDHQALVDQYIEKLSPAKTEAPPPSTTPSAPRVAISPAPTTTAAPSSSVRDPDQAAAAQKLFDEAKSLEASGDFPDAVTKLESIQTGYSSVDWPPGLADALTRVRAETVAKPQGSFFGVH